MFTNISPDPHPEQSISKFLALIGQPARIQILLVISVQDACVCHIEAALGMRQASISQHLMALRKAGLVEKRRDGRHIFYRLVHPEVVDILLQIARLTGSDPHTLHVLTSRTIANCSCPHCNPGLEKNLTCKKIV